MKYNLKRHKLLGALSRLFSKRKINGGKYANDIGMTYEEIDTFLNVKTDERDLIISELFKSKEISAFKLDGKGNGCIISDTLGISSFVNKKYLKENNHIFIRYSKIASGFGLFIIALLAFNFSVLEPNNLKLDKKQKTEELKQDSIQ